MLIFLCEALAVSYQAWYNKASKWLYFTHFDMLKKNTANEFNKAYFTELTYVFHRTGSERSVILDKASANKNCCLFRRATARGS